MMNATGHMSTLDKFWATLNKFVLAYLSGSLADLNETVSNSTDSLSLTALFKIPYHLQPILSPAWATVLQLQNSTRFAI